MRRIIFAENGSIGITTEKDRELILGNTVDKVVENLLLLNEAEGIDIDELYYSSTMHFSSEEGFENDEDAINLFDSAILKITEKMPFFASINSEVILWQDTNF